jgi:hypothetical protein
MDIPEEFLPNEFQKNLWWGLVIEKDGTDGEGYWHGWCPLHDNTQDPETPTALFNFLRGVMKCNGEPSCHPGQRAISLQNVFVRMYRK